MENLIRINGKVDEQYQEKCVSCGNLVYGYIKPLNWLKKRTRGANK